MTKSSWKLLSSFICLLLPIVLESQTPTIQVSLKKGLAEEPVAQELFWLYPKRVDLSGIPNDLDTMVFWACPFSVSQFLYEQYQYGRIYERFDGTPYTKEAFEKNRIHRENITDKEIKYKIYGISGLRNGKKIIAIDANNNGDLSDEIILEFDTTGLDIERRVTSYELTPSMIVNYEIFQGGKIIQKEKIVKIQPFVKLSNPPNKLFEDLKFSLRTFEEYSGILAFEKKKYHVKIDGYMDEDIGLHFNPYISIKAFGFSQDSTKEVVEAASVGNIIRLGGKLIRINAVDCERMVITFSPVDHYEEKDAEVFMAPQINTQDLNGRDFSLENLKGKYVFMHFWGTWCGPCKADHPALKNVYEQYKNKNIEFVGVASDASPEIVKNYLSKEKMSWTNLFVSNKDREKETIVNEYGINWYPTYVLINPAGEVILKGYLKEMQSELKRIFE